MSEDESVEFSEDDEYEVPSYPWSKDRTMYLMMSFCAEMQRATANFLEEVAGQVGADSNQKVDAELFRQEAAKQIETIFQEPETSDG